MIERPESVPSSRLVLLGASNVRMSLATAIETARSFLGEPVHVLAAVGHGRSYGQTTSVLGRQLTGITECGLWPEFSRQEPTAVDALITDIGNDLLYEVRPKQIIEWVRECVDRLLEQEARIVITRLPLANIERLSPLRFKLFRTIVFPRNRHSLEELKQLAIETDERIVELGRSHGLTVVEPSATWYGLDPIHLKYRHWSAAYEQFFASWRSQDSGRPRRVSWSEQFRAALWRAEQRIVFGRQRYRRQPIGRLRDGTKVSLY